MMRRRIALLLLASAPLQGASAQPQTVEAFLTTIYTLYQNGGLRGPPYWKDLDGYFTPDVARAIKRDRDDNPGQVGVVDFDLFTADQMGQVSSFSVKATITADKASAIVEFDRGNVIPSMAHGRVLMDLVRTQAGWRIAEMRWPGSPEDPQTLRGLLRLK
jgi:hypothetical protein